MSHIKQAHDFWKKFLNLGDVAIDATCGNGHDSLLLAQLVEVENGGQLICLDIQDRALAATKARLKKHLSSSHLKKITLLKRCHSEFPSPLPLVKLIVYNLGYLPKGNKCLTTKTETTLQSLKNGLKLLISGGALSITCYPGHLEGEREESAILQFAENLDSKNYLVCQHRWINRSKAPSWILIQKL